MPDEGFGSELWKNLQAVQFGKDGGIEAPVRANGRDGIEIGLDATATSDQSQTTKVAGSSPRRGWKRLFRR